MRAYSSVARIFIALAIVLGGYCNAEADEVTINPFKDNTLYEDSNGSLSNGAGGQMIAGQTGSRSGSVVRRAVMAFDVAGAVPAGSQIVSATLQITVDKTGTSASRDLNLFHLNEDWGEGGSNKPVGLIENSVGVGAPAQSNDATWVHRFFNNLTWSTQGGSFDAGSKGAVSVGGPGVYSWTSTAGIVADVQSWLDNPQSNFGWIVIGNETTVLSAKRFFSRSTGIAANRPQLTIVFSPPTQPTATPTAVPTATPVPPTATPTAVSPTPIPTLEPGPPVLGAVSDAGGVLTLNWTHSFATPAQFFGFVFDIYAGAFLGGGLGDTIFYQFLVGTTMGDIPLIFSGGYHAWISAQYPDGGFFVTGNPFTGIVFSGTPHVPTGVIVEILNTAERRVRLHWTPEVFGTWHYQIVVFKIDDLAEFTGDFVASEGPLGLSNFHFVDFGEAIFMPGTADYFAGTADFTLLMDGDYAFFIRGAAWQPPFTEGMFAVSAPFAVGP